MRIKRLALVLLVLPYACGRSAKAPSTPDTGSENNGDAAPAVGGGGAGGAAGSGGSGAGSGGAGVGAGETAWMARAGDKAGWTRPAALKRLAMAGQRAAWGRAARPGAVALRAARALAAPPGRRRCPMDAAAPAPIVLGTPSSPGAWTSPPVMTGPVPAIVYPSDQTRFPRNIYRTLFQWRSQGYIAVPPHLRWSRRQGDRLHRRRHPLCAGKTPAGAACWEADEASLVATSRAPTPGRRWRRPSTGSTRSTIRPRSTSRRRSPSASRSRTSKARSSTGPPPPPAFVARTSRPPPEDYITGKPPPTYASPEGHGEVRRLPRRLA